MKDSLVITILYIIISLFGIFMGLLFWLRKIPPNSYSGFRTEQTLADPDLWYRVNSILGQDMFALNVVTFILTIVLQFAGVQTVISAMILGTVLFIGYISIAIHCFRAF